MSTNSKLKGLTKEDGVFPTGKFEAWASADGTLAKVISLNDSGAYKVFQTFRGETAHTDAVREAGDCNARP